MDLQKYSDAFLARTLLPFIPRFVSPNQVSWVRILSLPFIYFLLVGENYGLGLFIFSIAALTDALDGAMARVRNQETETGKVLDAMADRGLIALVAFIFIPKYFGWGLLTVMAVLEIFNVAMAYRSKKKLGFNPGANWAGKVKMIIQCVAFGMIFIGLFSDESLWIGNAYLLLQMSLLFTLLQGFLYPQMLSRSANA